MRDTDDRFGWVSIVLHWLGATGYLGLFALGWYMVQLSYYDPLYNRLPALHKSFGVLLLVLVAAHVLWRWVNVRPAPLPTHASWEVAFASITHRLLFAGALAVLVSGYLIPTAKGAPIAVFGWFEAPALLHGFAGLEDTAGLAHKYLAYVILGLALLHTLAALKHHLMNRDETLKRMLGVKPRIRLPERPLP